MLIGSRRFRVFFVLLCTRTIVVLCFVSVRNVASASVPYPLLERPSSPAFSSSNTHGDTRKDHRESQTGVYVTYDTYLTYATTLI